jgi:hypothetical protein
MYIDVCYGKLGLTDGWSLTAFQFDICMYQQSHCTMIELLLAGSLTGQNNYSCLGCKQNVGSERSCNERSLQFHPSKSSLPPDFFPPSYLVIIPIWHDKPQQLYQPTAMATPWGTLACRYVLNTIVINPQACSLMKYPSNVFRSQMMCRYKLLQASVCVVV